MDIPRQSLSMRRLQLQCDALERQRHRRLGQLNGEIQALRIKYQRLADKKNDANTLSSVTIRPVDPPCNDDDEAFALPPGFRFSRDGAVKHPRSAAMKEVKAKEASPVAAVESAVVPSFVLASGGRLRLVGTVQDDTGNPEEAEPPGRRSLSVPVVIPKANCNVGKRCCERLFYRALRHSKTNCQSCEFRSQQRHPSAASVVHIRPLPQSSAVLLQGTASMKRQTLPQSFVASLPGTASIKQQTLPQSSTVSFKGTLSTKRQTLPQSSAVLTKTTTTTTISDMTATEVASDDGIREYQQSRFTNSSPELFVRPANDKTSTVLGRASSLHDPSTSTTLPRLTPSDSPAESRVNSTAGYSCKKNIVPYRYTLAKLLAIYPMFLISMGTRDCDQQCRSQRRLKRFSF